MSDLMPMRYAPNKQTATMQRSKAGKYMTVKQHEALMDKVFKEHQRRLSEALRRAETATDGLARMRPYLTRAIDVYQEAHRVTVDLANQVDAGIRRG